MIMIVLVGMSILFSYVAFYAQNYQTGVGSSILESLTIENVWFPGSNYVNITVYNTGTQANLGTDVSLKVVAVYENGTALQLVTPVNQGVVGAGKTVTFTASLTGSSQFQLGSSYVFKVVTFRGSDFQVQVQYANT